MPQWEEYAGCHMMTIRGVAWRVAAKTTSERSVWSPISVTNTRREEMKFILNVRFNTTDEWLSVYVYPKQPTFKKGKKLTFSVLLASPDSVLGAQVCRSALTTRDMLEEHYRRYDGLGYGQFLKLKEMPDQFHEDIIRILVEITDDNGNGTGADSDDEDA
jgi:hypothetical protein